MTLRLISYVINYHYIVMINYEMNLHDQLIGQMSRNISNFLFPIKSKHDPLPRDHNCDWGDHRIDIRRVIPSPTRDCILLSHNCNLAILTYLFPIHHLQPLFQITPVLNNNIEPKLFQPFVAKSKALSQLFPLVSHNASKLKV